jgi:hypothetical protein
VATPWWQDAPESARPAPPLTFDAVPTTTPPVYDRARLRQAGVVSGALHLVLLLAAGVVYWQAGGLRSAAPDRVIETHIDTRADADLVNPDEGLDPSKQFDVQATRIDAAPDDLMVRPEAVLPDVVAPPAAGRGAPPGPGSGPVGTDGLAHRGSAARRKALLASEGGNTETEAAVARALRWLAGRQHDDGSWSLDGTLRDDVAATGLALLPFLAAGQTHRSEGPGHPYTRTVLAGLTWLRGRQRPGGDLQGAGTMYSHAIATVCLCEAVGMTGDPQLQPAAQAAVNYVVRAQHEKGGWRYTPGTPGDVSVTGWQVQALRSGRAAGLDVPESAFEKASAFLDAMSADGGATYGYTDNKTSQPAMTAVALLCRQYGGWTPRKPALGRGVEQLKKNPPASGAWDVYYLYYATQVLHFAGGDDWHTFWNPRVRDLLVGRQNKSDGPDGGSWSADETQTGRAGGRHATTCLAVLTLEVYYRHLPLYQGG